MLGIVNVILQDHPHYLLSDFVEFEENSLLLEVLKTECSMCQICTGVSWCHQLECSTFQRLPLFRLLHTAQPMPTPPHSHHLVRLVYCKSTHLFFSRSFLLPTFIISFKSDPMALVRNIQTWINDIEFCQGWKGLRMELLQPRYGSN